MESPRGLDHLVIALRDLDAGARFYETLGFQVGRRNRHPWGTENRLIQFDGTFLELITVGEGAAIPEHAPQHFSFGAFVRDFLARREGLAMIVLDSVDAKGDARTFATAGLGDQEPFFFSRTGRRPDGGETTVAFTLAFTDPVDGMDEAFFVCQQHYPENFWNAAFQIHPNGAEAVTAVTLTAAHAGATRFLETFAGARAVATPSGERIALVRGALEWTIGAATAHAGFRVGITDLTAMEDRLRRAGLPFESAGDRLILRPNVAFGVAITFETR